MKKLLSLSLIILCAAVILSSCGDEGTKSTRSEPGAWTKTLGGTGEDKGYSICTDLSGNVYVAGSFLETVDFGGGDVTSKGLADVYIVKYDPYGTYKWAKFLGGTGDDKGYSICTDQSGNVYVAGYFSGTVDFGSGDVTSNGNTDVFIVKYDLEGTYKWANTFGDSDDDYGYSVCTDSAGNVYATGYFQSTVNFGEGDVTSQGSSDAFIIKYDSDGIYKLAKTFGGTQNAFGYSVCVDSSGNIYTTGFFYGTVDFGEGGVTSKGYLDAYITKYDPDGIYQWAKTFGGLGDDYGMSVCTDSSGYIYVTGIFNNIVDFGEGDVTSKGYSDIYIVKYNSDGS